MLDKTYPLIDYLRISVTDRCNLKCLYCIPRQGFIVKPHRELLTFEEIARLTDILAGLGVKKVRITGGEPLVRKGVTDLVRSISLTGGIDEVLFTTNGTYLARYAAALKQSGIRRINISLDTLREDRFRHITRNSSSLTDVLRGIAGAKAAGLQPLKLNIVIMKGVNDDEIVDFVDFALSENLILRFIEFMNITPLWKREYFFPIAEVRRAVEDRFILEKTSEGGSGPAEYYKVNGQGVVGFIHTDENNCKKCNRLRLTSVGELKICLYESKGIDLKAMLRGGMSDTEIRAAILSKLCVKGSRDYRDYELTHQYMSAIGG